MPSRLTALALVLAALGPLACAGAQARGPRMVGTEAAKNAPPSELVCTMEYDTGSNIPTRFCRTRAEAQADRDQGAPLPGNGLSAPIPAQIQRGAGGGGG